VHGIGINMRADLFEPHGDTGWNQKLPEVTCRSFTHHEPDISVVIVSWNVASLLRDCLNSLEEESQVNNLRLQIIVVDNASTDNTVEMLQKEYPHVELITNSENVGFAVANNQGFALTKANYILVLNPDTYVKRNSLTELLNSLKSNSDIGIACPKLICPNGEIQITSARRIQSLRHIITIDILHLNRLPIVGKYISTLKYPYNYNSTTFIEAGSGAAFLVKKEVISKLGGFEESFIHCGEDMDLFFRSTRSGYKILYNPNAVIFHYGGQSSKQASETTYINACISVELYLLRCRGYLTSKLYRIAIIFWSFLRTLYYLLLMPFYRTRQDNLKREWRILRKLISYKALSSPSAEKT